MICINSSRAPLACRVEPLAPKKDKNTYTELRFMYAQLRVKQTTTPLSKETLWKRGILVGTKPITKILLRS